MKINIKVNKDKFNELIDKILNFTEEALFILSLIVIFLTVYRLGFSIRNAFNIEIKEFTFILQILIFIGLLVRLLNKSQTDLQKKQKIGIVLLLIFIAVLLTEHFFFFKILVKIFKQWYFYFENIYVVILNSTVFLIGYSTKKISFIKNIKPPLLFLLSFVILIIGGALLLLLPQATRNGISITDAFFTSTSAVCVTGLNSVDTALTFTFVGKIIILALIQLGGLGIMTFTTFFALYFSSSSSLKDFLIARELSSSSTFTDLGKTLFKIIIFTLIIEVTGALLIWVSLPIKNFANFNFAVFHSISAFCNAGFSTKSLNLMDPIVVNNYFVHFVIAVLIIMGGIGFPVLMNFYDWAEHIFRNILNLIRHRPKVYKAKLFNINTRIVILTTFWLLVGGTVFFLLFEYNNTLKGHNFFEKVILAFFASVTPRTAGFNTIDYSKILPITAIFTMFLMWIGASPGGTGGGIKTSTFALALMNIFNLAKGRNRIEVRYKEVSNQSVLKAFASLILSIFLIGLVTSIISVLNPNIDVLRIAFESTSAFGTVGLSMGLTPLLCSGSKWVLIVTMFLGRVGFITLFIAFLKQVKTINYKYPEETINI